MKPKKSKKVLNRLSSRVVVTGTVILIQLVWVLLISLGVSNISVFVNITVRLIGLIMIIYIIGTDSNSSAKMTWILVLAFVPAFGAPLFMLFGNKYPGRSFHKRITETNDRLKKHLIFRSEYLNEMEISHPQITGKFRYLEHHCGFPVYKNTDMKYYPVGENLFEDMMRDLKSAEKYIFLEYFIIDDGKMWDEILSVLCKKAEQGVDVRIIYDDVGCVSTLPSNFPLQMQKHGIQVIAFNRFIPIVFAVMNHRDHRKITVVDGVIAYTGGVNIADEYINERERFGHWKDNGIRLYGDGAFGFTMIFIEMWDTLRRKSEDISPLIPPKITTKGAGYVQPFGDSPLDYEDVAENLFLDIIGSSRKYLYIYTPYLIINASMSGALRRAAKRDVDVRIITPAIPDKKFIHRMTRSNYLPLLSQGVKIYEYTPGFLHAKSLIADDEIGVIGSINMDFRSLNLHFECGAVVHNDCFISSVKQDFFDTLSKSREIFTEDCKTSFLGKMYDAVMRVFSPLL